MPLGGLQKYEVEVNVYNRSQEGKGGRHGSQDPIAHLHGIGAIEL